MFRASLLIILLTASTYGPTQAQGSLNWKTVQGWDIRIDRTLGNACFMIASWENGTILRIGFSSGQTASSVPFMLLGNVTWTSMQEGKDYNLQLQFDQASPWDVPARGFRVGQFVFLLIGISKIEFIEEFMRKLGVKIYYQGNIIANLTLDGSFAAFRETVKCQVQMDTLSSAPGAQPSGDPFN